jgi:hypothetical protein
MMSAGFGLSLQLLVFSLSSGGIGDHSFQFSSLKVRLICLRPLENSPEHDQTLEIFVGWSVAAHWGKVSKETVPSRG